MHFKFLKQKYECEIRRKCNEHNVELENCLNNNFNDEDFCRKEIDSFKKCLRDYNRNFNKKYNGHSYYFLKDDVFTSK